MAGFFYAGRREKRPEPEWPTRWLYSLGSEAAQMGSLTTHQVCEVARGLARMKPNTGMTTTSNVMDSNQRLLRFLSSTPEQQAAIDRILSGQMPAEGMAAEAPKGPLLMRVKDAAGLLGVHRATIWRLVKAGRLQTVELLGSLRVRRADLDNLVNGKAGVPKR